MSRYCGEFLTGAAGVLKQGRIYRYLPRLAGILVQKRYLPWALSEQLLQDARHLVLDSRALYKLWHTTDRF